MRSVGGFSSEVHSFINQMIMKTRCLVSGKGESTGRTTKRCQKARFIKAVKNEVTGWNHLRQMALIRGLLVSPGTCQQLMGTLFHDAKLFIFRSLINIFLCPSTLKRTFSHTRYFNII